LYTSSNATSTNMSGSDKEEIALPAGYKLLSWKIRDGSSVRIGETLAIAVPISESSSSSNESTPSAAPAVQHKRPTRRKRPVPAPAQATVVPPEVSVLPDDDEGDKKPAARPTSTGATTATTTSNSIKPATATQSTNNTSGSGTTKINLLKENQVAIRAQVDGIVHFGTGGSASHIASRSVIGTIEQCQHPTVIEGSCAVCGCQMLVGQQKSTANHTTTATGTQINNSNNSNNNSDHSRMTVAGLTVTVSQAESQRLGEQDAARLHKLQKLSLVLDLDHTLVHATGEPLAQHYCDSRADVRTLVLPVPSPPLQPPQGNQQQQQPQRLLFQQHFVKLRPYVKEFFESCMDTYEVGVYTAGTREYAEQVCLVIARHLVGAPCDPVQLDRLRHRVAYLQHKEHQRLKLKQDDDSVAEEKKEPANAGEKKKRKRVTFGETDAKTDPSHQKELEELREELQRAEQLERQAMELRQKLFGSRVCSRTDVGDLGTNVKSLKRIFPCGGSMAAVVDDREDVWANGAADMHSTRRGEPPENLLLVRPYHWSSFAGFADVNNAAGVDLGAGGEPSDARESETDEQLRATADILKRLHHRYYNTSDESRRANVPEILQRMRSEVLSGCQLVLSGVVPLHQQQRQQNSQGPRPHFVRYGESLGARVLTAVTKSTTHVVAAKDGTDKIVTARRVKGCRIVKAAWLMDCVRSLKRCDERKYILGPPVTTGIDIRDSKVQPLADSTRENSSSSSGDDEDDDFAADLESEMMEDAS